MAPLMIYLKKLHAFAGLKLYVNLMGMIAISFTEGIGIYLLAPFISLINNSQFTTSQIPFANTVLSPLHAIPAAHRLPAVILVLALLLIGQAYLQRKQTNLSLSIQQGFIRHLRLDIYQAIMQAQWSFIMRRRKSDFTHLMTSELSRVSQGVALCLRMLTTVIFTIVQIGFALSLSVKLTAFIVVCGLVLTLYSRKFINRSKVLGEQTSELAQNYMSGLTEHFGGIKDIKGNRMEDRHLTLFADVCQRMERNMMQFARLQSASQFYYKAVSILLIALFAFVSFSVLQVQMEQLLLIIVIFSRLWPKFSSLQASWEQLAQSMSAFANLSAFEQECSAMKEMDIDVSSSRQRQPIHIEDAIECSGISYRYDRNAFTYALQDIHMRIPVNGMTAIVGKSGAGKSTLIDVIIGLIRPEKGAVLLDGRPLDYEGAFALREAVSYVSQEPFLFHATIKENLLLSSPDASTEQMWEALRFAAADELVNGLPQGLDTVIGDRGVRLSGGERQRIVLARAILRKPAILVLDEATSALDSENESKIQSALERLKGRMTILVIAHRLSTIRRADQVVVLDKGRIVQRGSYDKLSSEEQGMFGRLLELQAQ